MSVQFSTDVRDDRLDQIQTTVGASAVLKIWSGSAPANCAAADSGTTLATCTTSRHWSAIAVMEDANVTRS